MLQVVATNLRSADLRRAMVDCQIRPFDVTDAALLEVFYAMPREAFLSPANTALAYSDGALMDSAGNQQRRLLEPMVLARLLQGAELGGACAVLDVGGAGGYSAAILSQLCKRVVALENSAEFSQRAAAACVALGCANVETITGDLNIGAPEKGPFDVILVNGAVEVGLETLLAQLSPGGRLLTICREAGHSGRACRATRFDAINGGGSGRRLFDAAASTLPGFAVKPVFAF